MLHSISKCHLLRLILLLLLLSASPSNRSDRYVDDNIYLHIVDSNHLVFASGIVWFEFIEAVVIRHGLRLVLMWWRRGGRRGIEYYIIIYQPRRPKKWKVQMIYVACIGEKYNGKRTFRVEFKTRNVYRVQNFLNERFSLSLKFFIRL